MTQRETLIIKKVNEIDSWGRFVKVAKSLGVSKQYVHEVCKKWENLIKPITRKPVTFICRICDKEKLEEERAEHRSVCIDCFKSKKKKCNMCGKVGHWKYFYCKECSNKRMREYLKKREKNEVSKTEKKK